MALQRIRIMSPNCSSRGGAVPRLLVIHTAEGSRTIESLGSFFANPASQVSSHAGADDTPGRIGEYVDRSGPTSKAWTQGNANPYSVSIELCGFAAWTPADWAGHAAMVENCGLWLAEESAALGIPLRRLTSSEAQGGQAGVCGHVDLGAAGGGHWDPGPDFPWDNCLRIAQGGSPTPAPLPPSGAPPFPGTLLVNYTRGQGTSTWQAKMAERGWTIAVDDEYGPASEGVCRQFQAEKHLGVDGIVGPETWAATWNLPVT